MNTTMVPNPGGTLQTMTLELQSRIVQSTVDPLSRNYGVLVVMDNVAEVFGPTLMN